VNASFIIHYLFLKAFIFSRCNLVLLVFLMITSIVYLFNKFNSKHKNLIFLMERRSDDQPFIEFEQSTFGEMSFKTM
jgi:hypothetical protein